MDGVRATGAAPGKAILFGEHAVVYGRPALAVPVTQVQARVTVEHAPPGSGLTLVAADLGRVYRLRSAAVDQPLAVGARLALAHMGLTEPNWRVTIRSTVPVASGLGSGAAVAAALVRALAEAAGRSLDPAEVSALVYETEKLHHGTPSGIDNTVIAYGRPVFFVRGQPPVPFTIGRAFWVAIADTGVASPTRITVGDVRRGWTAEPARYERLFDAVAEIVLAARAAIEGGRTAELGPLMDANQALLAEIGVSSPELETLAAAARRAGAAGAKLSGGGRGGNLIALVDDGCAAAVEQALHRAGARRVIVTRVAEDLAS